MATKVPVKMATKVSLEEDVVGGPTTDDDGATTSTGASAKEGAPLRPAACSTTTMLLFDRSERERALYAPCVPSWPANVSPGGSVVGWKDKIQNGPEWSSFSNLMRLFGAGAETGPN